MTGTASAPAPAPATTTTTASATRRRVAVIVDNGQIDSWQSAALSEIGDLAEICLVLDCANTRHKRAYTKHFAYYALNAFTIRNRHSRSAPYAPGCPVIRFEAAYNGAWQSLPKDVLAAVEQYGIDCIVKFGMGLLRIDDALAGCPILSYHHGDPEQYRGRPAGFYELVNDADAVGLIVQKLSNTLDGGAVLARDYAKITRHSYKQTIEQLYQASRHTLRKALIALSAGDEVPIAQLGRNYRLPANITVLTFLFRLTKARLAHVLYGMFREKRWQIAEAEIGNCTAANLGDALDQGLASATHHTAPPGYSFLADPFYHPDGDNILAEALNAVTGLGEIIAIKRGGTETAPCLTMPGHLSYPFTLSDAERTLILPEMASHQPPALFPDTGPRAESFPLQGLESERLLDATHHVIEGHHYIFASRKGQPDSLHLFVSDALMGPYRIHPASPVRTDPRGARMAGRIVAFGSQLVRFGQDNCRAYGRAAIAFSIDRINPWEYRESRIARIAFSDRSGPHTIDRRGDRFVFDYYHEPVAWLAGYRRLRARLSARRHRRAQLEP